jgi:hypothetical protein
MAQQKWKPRATYYVVDANNNGRNLQLLTYGTTSLQNAKNKAKEFGKIDGKNYAVIKVIGFYQWRKH